MCVKLAVGRSEDVGSLFFVFLYFHYYFTTHNTIVKRVHLVKDSLENSSSPLGRRMK